MDSSSLATYFPPPMRRILIVAVPVVVACAFLAGMEDQRAGPGTMSVEAIAARLSPVAHVELAAAAPIVTAAAKDASPAKTK